MSKYPALDRLRSADPRRWLVGFDFDGTLSPIEHRPEESVLDPAMRPAVEQLRLLVGHVAVVSGRDRAALAPRLPADWLALASYGLELPEAISASGYPEGFDPVAARKALTAVGRELTELIAEWPEARLETKTWGRAIHFRDGGEAAFSAPETLEKITAAAARHDCKVVVGRLVIEVEPKGAVDKGWAMRHLVSVLSPSAVVFAGDDLGDVAAWQALRRMGGSPPAVTVGIASSELPPDALQVCDVVLEDRSELSPLIRELLTLAEA